MDVADILLILFAVCALLVILLLIRRLRLGMGHSVFDCVLRAPKLGRSRWRPGLARYLDSNLQWYPLWSFRFGPALEIPRRAILDVALATDTDEPRALRFNEDVRIVHLTARYEGREIDIELLLPASSSLGLMSWIEAAPRQYLQH